MPELPEVETVMRGLAPRLVGRKIIHTTVFRVDLRRPVPPGLSASLNGTRVVAINRRGKYLLITLSSGSTLLIHLGMSGRLVIGVAGQSRQEHEHVQLLLDDETQISLVDPRRFGLIDLVPNGELERHALLHRLGPEPLGPGFTPRALTNALARRQSPVKIALLDQTVVAGLGNIYASESLFRAEISPFRAANTISKPSIGQLVRAIKSTLRSAIDAGGSSIRDYVQPNGELGYFQHAWRVYGRDNQPCERCPQIKAEAPEISCPLIQRASQSGRSTYFCPRTQL